MVAKRRRKRTRSSASSPTAATSQAPKRLRWRRFILGLVLLAGAAVYANSLGNDFVWDDDKLIVQDPAIKTTKHFSEIWLKDFFYRHEDDVAYGYYRPAVTMTYIMDYNLWSLDPRGYHLTNVLLHVGCTLLVALCLMALGIDDRAVMAATLLFAVHPIHTENVTWIAGRTDLVAFLFTALSLLLVVRSQPPPAPGTDATGNGERTKAAKGDRSAAPGKRRWLLVLSLVSFALAMLAKEMSLVLLPWLGLIYLIRYRLGWIGSVRATLPHAAVAAAYFVWRFGVIRLPGPGDASGATFFEVLITAPSVMVRYLGKLLAPVELNAYLQHPYVESLFDLRFVLPAALLAALAWLTFKLRERYPDLFLMAVLLPVTFLPVLNFKRIAGPNDMGSVMAERFCYFPSFPMVGLFGIAFAIALRDSPKAWTRQLAMGTLAALVIGGSILTVYRNRDWNDELSFLNKTLEQSPKAVLLWGNLADEHTKSDNFEAAADALDRGQKLSSGSDYQIASSRVFWYASQGKPEDAIPLQERIARTAGRGAAQARNNLAYLYRVTGREQEAQRILRALLSAGRDYSDVHVNLAEIYRSQGLAEKAIEHYEEAYVESPHDSAIALSLAALHLGAEGADRAEKIYRQQLELYPDDPDLLGNLATTRFRAGDLEGAFSLYRNLVGRHPGYVHGRISYAQALFSANRLPEAIRQLEAAAAAAAGTRLEQRVLALLAEARAGLAAGTDPSG